MYTCSRLANSHRCTPMLSHIGTHTTVHTHTTHTHTHTHTYATPVIGPGTILYFTSLVYMLFTKAITEIISKDLWCSQTIFEIETADVNPPLTARTGLHRGQHQSRTDPSCVCPSLSDTAGLLLARERLQRQQQDGIPRQKVMVSAHH